MLELLAEYGIHNPVLPAIAGAYEGNNLVVCGDGLCLWEDLEAFGCRSDDEGGSVKKPGWDFMVVNMAGAKFPGVVEHWFSNSGYLVERFAAVRRQEYPRHWVVKHKHCLDNTPGFHVWPWTGHGTSGLGAVVTGLYLGYDRIVLCGVPLDNRPHNGEAPWRKTNFVNEVRGDMKHWLRVADFAGDRVKSMSGQTRVMFGHPSDCDCRSEGDCSMLDNRCQNTNIAVC